MIPGPDAQRIKAHLLIWWIFCASYLMGLIALYFIIVRDKPLPPANAFVRIGVQRATGCAGLAQLFGPRHDPVRQQVDMTARAGFGRPLAVAKGGGERA